MRKFGLIGFPLSHSFSKKYFEEKFKREKISDCSYQLFELPVISDFPSFVKANSGLSGLNVTIPHKEGVVPFIDWLSPEAKEIGAVNCIKWNKGKAEGWNTDWYGFETALQKFLTSKPEQAFILGTGGSSKAVEFVLKKMAIPFFKVSRTTKSGCIAYDEIAGKMQASNLFINTSPLGMFPDIKAAPSIPYNKLTAADYLFDLVYNPAETEFLKRGKERNTRTKNGLEMLELQAEKSWEIWNS